MVKYSNTKKANVSNILMIFLAIGIFGLISVMIATIGYLQYAIGHDYVVLNLYDVSQQEGFANTSQFQTAYETVVTDYQSIDINDLVDDVWFFAYGVVVIISLYLAYRSRAMNYFSFISMLTYGLMMVLFVIGIFGVIISWWYNEILLKLFINLAVNPVLFEYYVRNFSFLFMIHAVVLLLINVIDFDFATIMSRKQKEQDSIGDEIL